MNLKNSKTGKILATAVLSLILLIYPTSPGDSIVEGEDTALFADHLVISEIYYNALSERDSEFIEFYNPLDSSIDLTSWDFRIGGDSTWVNFSQDTDQQANLTIPSGGYLLLTTTDWASRKDDSSWPAGDVIDYLGLTNGGETIQIRNGAETIVDSVTYEGAAGNGESVERKASSTSTAQSMRDPSADGDLGNAYDTDDFTTDFVDPLQPEPQNTASAPEFFEEPAANQPPVADPGGPYQCSPGQTVELNGSNSYDPDGTISSYQWDFNQNGTYDDASGERIDFVCTAGCSTEVSLKVTDDANATDTQTTSITITSSSDFELSVDRHTLPADGSFSVEITAIYLEGETVTFGAEAGSLSTNSAVTNSNQEASVTLTAPAEPGPAIIKATAGGRSKATTVLFQGPTTPNITEIRTAIVEPGQTSGTMDAPDTLGAEMTVTKSGSEGEVAVSLGTYASNPKSKYPLNGKLDRYYLLHSDYPEEISELTLRFYPQVWPETPRVRYWDGSSGKWVSFAGTTQFPDEGCMEVVIDGESPFNLLNPYASPIAVGELDQGEVTVSHAGWNMVSIPIEPEVSDPASLFPGVEASKICRWDQSANNHQGGYVTAVDGFDEVEVSYSNWIYVPMDQIPASYHITGLYDGTVEIDLSERGWHQVGLPFDYGWNSMGVKGGGAEGVYNMEEATGEKDLLEGTVWKWDPERGRYYGYDTSKEDKVLRKGVGYWVYAKQKDVTLLAPYKYPPPVPSAARQVGEPISAARAKDLRKPPPPPNGDVGAEINVFAYPNPVSGNLPITFSIDGPNLTYSRLTISSPRGKTIYDTGCRGGDIRSWNLCNGDGAVVPNGVYLYWISGVTNGGNKVSSGVKQLLVLK